jgi:hypothetical protein
VFHAVYLKKLNIVYNSLSVKLHSVCLRSTLVLYSVFQVVSLYTYTCDRTTLKAFPISEVFVCWCIVQTAVSDQCHEKTRYFSSRMHYVHIAFSSVPTWWMQLASLNPRMDVDSVLYISLQ